MRKHALVAEIPLSKLKKNIIKHFVIPAKNQQKYDDLSSNQGKSLIRTAKISP